MNGVKVRCVGCGGLVPDIEGPTHRYMKASPGCWQAYGEVLAREYSDAAYRSVHRLTSDTYAVQHPGQPSAQSIQSVCGHLMSLCLVIERAADAAYATRVLGLVVREKGRFAWLTPPRFLGAITAVDVAAVSKPAVHTEKVRAWAESAWSAWAEHHETVRNWLPTR